MNRSVGCFDAHTQFDVDFGLYIYIYICFSGNWHKMSTVTKCGYCNALLKLEKLLKHSCFDTFDSTSHTITLDGAGKFFMSTTITVDSTASSSSKTDMDKHKEERRVPEAQQLDEDLISVVQQRPALYDHRLPSNERTKLIKNDLWQEVSNCLDGAYSTNEAEKRWQYLRDCYSKSCKKLKKKEEIHNNLGNIPKLIHKPSFRFHNNMNFLDDILEHKQRSSSLRLRNRREAREVVNDSRSSSPFNDSFDDTDIENRPPLTPSPVSDSAIPTTSSQIRRRSPNNDEVDETYMHALQTNVIPSPIDGFMLRLAEGMRRLPYKARSKLEMAFLAQLYETEEELGLLDN